MSETIHDFLEADGRRLEYHWIAAQNLNRPILVLLHEGLGSLAIWKDFPQRLAEATGCGVLTYSRYGYGRSTRLEEARGIDYMHHEARDSLPQVLAARSIEQPLLIGHSDGASIALLYAAAGRAVSGLILEAPHVFVEDLTVESIAKAKTLYKTTDLGQKLGRYHDDVERTFWGWNDIWLDPAFRDWNIESGLSHISAPMLLIQGEDDEYGTKVQTDAIVRQFTGSCETLFLPDCGHAPHRDQPEATLSAMTAFITRSEH